MITFDTGMLVALERRHQRARSIFRRAIERQLSLLVPSPVVAEWWRGRTDVREDILAAIHVEPVSEAVARLAGEALASVRGTTAIDAIVMASAASTGGIVYTSDVADLGRLTTYFRNVRVLAV